MSTLILLLVTGVGLGGLYFLVASGLSLIYGLMGVLNFAHGSFLTLGAFAGLAAAGAVGAGTWGGLLLGLLVGALTGAAAAALTELGLIRPLYNRHIEQVLVTVGLSLATVALFEGIWGPNPRNITGNAWLSDTTELLGARIPNTAFLNILAAALVLGGIVAFLRYTRYGLIIRAGVENRSMVTALGIDVRKIATVTGNSSDQVVLFFACAKAGLVLAPLSWRLSPRELADELDRSDPALVLVEEEFAALADAALERLPLPPSRTGLGRGGVEARVPAPTRRGLEERPLLREVRDDDPLLLVFTSGTGGSPKGALLTHANCFWNNLSLSRIVELSSADVVLSVLPQFHVGGWNIQPLLAWWTGATVVLERTFEPERVLRLVADRRVTTMMGVPTNYLLLAEHPGFATADLSSLRHAVVGGAPMPEPLLRAWHRRGVALTQGYGLTEAGPNVLCLPNDVARDRVGSAGVPYPHVEVAVADPATGEHLPGAATGELLVRGPSVFAGYFRDPDATAASFARGWLRTGDLVERDADGYYRVVDRLKDVFITGGENVTPAEVEAVLRRHPAVADAAVVGVPDERWGEVGHAFVVARPGTFTDAEELAAFCRAELAHYKAPRHFDFVPDLPRTSLNKVVRAALPTAMPSAPPTTPTTTQEAR